jgi:hypothetical protein
MDCLSYKGKISERSSHVSGGIIMLASYLDESLLNIFEHPFYLESYYFSK